MVQKVYLCEQAWEEATVGGELSQEVKWVAGMACVCRAGDPDAAAKYGLPVYNLIYNSHRRVCKYVFLVLFTNTCLKPESMDIT